MPLRSGSVAVLMMLNGKPLNRRSVAATVIPPVCGTSPRPLITRLCRRSRSVGPSLASRFRSSSNWKLIGAVYSPLVLPREYASVYDTRPLQPLAWRLSNWTFSPS